MRTHHPRRVQVGGNRFSPRVPTNSIWAMREAPGHARSVYANPHAIGVCKKTCRGRTHDLDEALALYAAHLDAHPEIVRRAAMEPDTVRFACRCPLDERCHVDELLRRVDELRAAA